MRPEFDHITQYISELGERGSATEFMMRYGAFEFTGILYLFFAIALQAIIQDGWRSALSAALIGFDGIGRIGAGVFPCDPGCNGFSSSQELHRLFATVGFLSGVMASVAWGITFRRHVWLRGLSWYSLWSGILALLFLILMSWDRNPVKAPGLFEHLATGVLSLWVMVFAIRLMGASEKPLELK